MIWTFPIFVKQGAPADVVALAACLVLALTAGGCRADAVRGTEGCRWCHGFNEGLALSPSGSHVAVAIAQSPTNELVVLDLSTREAIVIRHPMREMLLAHPAFSPDETKLAFIASPPQYMAVSELWQVSLEDFSFERTRDLPTVCFAGQHLRSELGLTVGCATGGFPRHKQSRDDDDQDMEP